MLNSFVFFIMFYVFLLAFFYLGGHFVKRFSINAHMVVYKHLGPFQGSIAARAPHASYRMLPKLHPDACIQAPEHLSQLNSGPHGCHHNFLNCDPNACTQATGHFSELNRGSRASYDKFPE